LREEKSVLNSPMADPTAPLCARERHGFVRVAAVSPELRLGDPPENARLTKEALRRVAAEGCRVAVFPELGLTGYSCADLFHLTALREAAVAALLEVAEATAGMGLMAVVGLPLAIDGRLFNVAAVVADGTVLGVVPKTFLPNSGEFYEARWFASSHILAAPLVTIGGVEVPVGTDLLFEAQDVPGLVVGVEICEDLWGVHPPSGGAALAGATLLVNLSASNEVLGKVQYRRGLVAQQSARCIAAYVYAGAGAWESCTDIVYSGHGLVAENGVVLAETERFSFETQVAVTDLDVERLGHERQRSSAFKGTAAPEYRRVKVSLGSCVDSDQRLRRHVTPHPFVPSADHDRRIVCEEIFAIQATGLARRLRHTRSKTAVLGLSGGLDSTLALLVLIEALKRAGLPRSAALTVTMPGFGTTARTKGNAELLAEAFGVTLRTIPIAASVTQHFTDIGHPEGTHDVTFENAQARERTQILMDIANQTGGLVVGTGDLSEAALGWCTFNGDHMSMYHVNSGVPKTLVRYMIDWCARELYAAEAGAILHDVIATPISPELLPVGVGGELEQTTEGTVGPYELHDFFLFHFVRHGCSASKLRFLAGQAFGERYAADVVDRWLREFLRRFAQSQFKRSSMPDGPKVGSVALSPRGDWRMPSDWAGDLTTL
jgi:NAD+ synthase (glutamine-hydrolysing)